MTSSAARILTAAAALAALLVSAPARADHDDRWDRGAREPRPAYPPPPAPAYAPRHDPPPPVVAERFGPPHDRARWSAAPAVARLRAEYRELDLARDRFYATWRGDPWQRDRFESWYAGQRAELDHRWGELMRRFG